MSRFTRPLAIGQLVRPHLAISAGVNRFTSLWSSLGYRGLGHRTLGGTNDCTLQSIVPGDRNRCRLLRGDQDNRHVLRCRSVRMAAVCDLWARSQPRLFLTPSSGPAKARDRSPRPPFLRLIVEVRIMSSLRYRKLGEDCLERAAQARKSEDSDAWLLIAKDWLLLAAEFNTARQQSETSPQR